MFYCPINCDTQNEIVLFFRYVYWHGFGCTTFRLFRCVLQEVDWVRYARSSQTCRAIAYRTRKQSSRPCTSPFVWNTRTTGCKAANYAKYALGGVIGSRNRKRWHKSTTGLPTPWAGTRNMNGKQWCVHSKPRRCICLHLVIYVSCKCFESGVLFKRYLIYLYGSYSTQYYGQIQL